MNNAQKAYETFRDIIDNPYTRSNTAKLSIIYTIVCKAEKDEQYRKELEEYIIPDSTGMNVLEAIDTFFKDYNNTYGLDIRDTLTPFNNPDYPDGLYFTVDTFKKINGELVSASPIFFKKGEEVFFKATLRNYVTDEETKAPVLKYDIFTEGKGKTVGKVENASFIEASTVCDCAGSVLAKFFACDENEEVINGSETAYSGALFDFTELETTIPTPDDFEEFWKSEVERLKTVSPCDTTVTKYEGDVAFAFDVDKTNYYHIKKADVEYIRLLRSKHLTTVKDDILDTYDLWEFSLKSLGPCPATGYISFPKNAEAHSLPIQFIYAGYSAHSPNPFFSENYIYVYSTHHGYPCALSDNECYNELNKGILANYGRGGTAVNAGFDNKSDCYCLYLNLRNIQALRYVTNPDFSADIPEIADKWNGKVIFSGGSLGGYQTLAVTALSKFLDEKFEIALSIPEIPGFCDFAAFDFPNRLKSNVLRINCKNAEYFDGSHIAKLITTPVDIKRCGLGDEVCVSHSICVAFNSLKGKKTIRFLQNSSHGYRPKNEKDLWHVFEA